ncbi:hydrolase [Anaerotignum lactatifermentans]|uniref:Hydrolase n=1 Tax=Anaerotignum lactatifermentans TaxID=160404 RepID=A0ABS2GBD7_9FIRM|nr:hydrolase [Anaerotignum lactatifermentans]MBM6828446.1 hydrolase [Anaerotignum lactatifermentans]MBM6877853.1 hydrolase [Anaerotignum lactatifermentans]MBM6950029.1 hydrolase [Anaerotignum lactatifermentans]
MAEKNPPRIDTKLRKHIVSMPEEIWAASGIVIWGRRIKSLVFSTDIAVIRNCNADAVLAVYPFTPQQVITNSIITASSIPVFAGVGGGTTTGLRVVMLAKDAEALGAMAVVLNAPTSNEIIRQIYEVVDIPIVVTVLDENTDIDARIAAGTGILNISAAARTPQVVKKIREKYPNIPIIATGGPTRESISRTIEAGANAISFTPPTAMELFHGLMSRYRSEHVSRTQGEQSGES